MIQQDDNEWKWFSYSAKTHIRCGYVLKISEHLMDMEDATEKHEASCTEQRHTTETHRCVT